MSFRRLSRIVEELSQSVEQGATILVEGKKDEEALKHLLFEETGNLTSSEALKEPELNGKIIKVSGSGLKLFEIAEIAVESSPKIIILTDFDKKGELLAKKLSKDIQSLGSHPDLSIRRKIMNISRKYIKDIESLPKHIKRLEMENYPHGSYL